MSQSHSLQVKWLDAGREPQCPANPEFPAGVDIDLSGGAPATCKVDLPYPAPRCGVYIVRCEACGMKVGITAAGRADDPRSVTFACNRGTIQ